MKLLKNCLSLFLWLLFFFIAPPGFTVAEEEWKEVTFEYIYKSKDLGIEPIGEDLPKNRQWSKHGNLLAYLVSSGTEAPNLVIYDPVKDATAFAITPPALYAAIIKLPSEPSGVSIQNTTTIYGFPKDATDIAEIKSYSWIEKDERNVIQFSIDQETYQWKVDDNVLVSYEKSELPESEKQNLTDSPNERYAAYTRDHNLYVYDRAQKKEIQLTHDGSDTLYNGRLSWVYWEELFYRNSYKGFWWSPDNHAIAYLQFNHDGVSQYPIIDYTQPVPSVTEMYYPKAGTKNPEVRLGVVDLSTRDTRWINLGAPWEYIVRVKWLPDGERLAVQVLNRDQNHLQLLFVDPDTGKSAVILEEISETWIMQSSLEAPWFLEEEDSFLWFSERSGYNHLYKYSLSGDDCVQLTSGEWEILGDVVIDEDSGTVYFSGNRSSPLEKQYYSVSLDGGDILSITEEPGWHSLMFSENKKYAVDQFSSSTIPRKIQVINHQGQEIAVLGETIIEDYAPYRFLTPEYIEINHATADISFHASMLKPADFDPNIKYPVIMHIYGGPAGQVVRNSFVSTGDMAFVNKGFILFRFDNRGTPGRGKHWLETIHRNFTEVPLQDLEIAVDYLKQLQYVDAENIGVWGWSHGGYLTCCAMTMKPGLFKAGAAVAPVTDFRLYDTIYTELYMDHPDENEDGYKASSAVEFADQLEGKLFLAHGMNDDNVHIQNIYHLVDALIEAEKDYELYIYPERDHGIGGDERRYHLFQQMLEFFQTNLQNKFE